MASQNDRRVCCFGVVETYVDDVPARAAPRRTSTITIERTTMPRPLHVPELHPLPAEPQYIFATTPPLPPLDNDGMAKRIAEMLAPLTIANHETTSRRLSAEEIQRVRQECRREVEARAIKEQQIEQEAIRRVRERNDRRDRQVAELRALENAARARVECDFRDSACSVRTARDRLVVVEQENRRSDRLESHRCSSCHELGHRSRDCNAVVTVSVARPERRRSVVYHRVETPRRQVRYVPGF
jgi:type IV secretory pathway VirB10-like protein